MSETSPSRRRIVFVLPFRSLALLSAVVLAALGCPDKNRPFEAGVPLPSQVIEGFKMIESTSGTRSYALTADSAYLYDQEKRIDVFNPAIDFYDERGTLYSHLVAKTGTVRTTTSDLVARSEVVVLTRDSTELRTDSLTWLNSARKVMTDAWVFIHSPDGDIQGRGLVSDARLTKIVIRDKVTGTSPYKFGR